MSSVQNNSSGSGFLSELENRLESDFLGKLGLDKLGGGSLSNLGDQLVDKLEDRLGSEVSGLLDRIGLGGFELDDLSKESISGLGEQLVDRLEGRLTSEVDGLLDRVGLGDFDLPDLSRGSIQGLGDQLGDKLEGRLGSEIDGLLDRVGLDGIIPNPFGTGGNGGQASVTTINGTADSDDLAGTNGDDIINARAGADRIDAGAGDDKIALDGAGDKLVDGGVGNDVIGLRGVPADYTVIRNGADTLFIDPFGDTITARNVEDVFFQGADLTLSLDALLTGEPVASQSFVLSPNSIGAELFVITGDTARLTGPGTDFTFTGVDTSALAFDGPIIATGGSGIIAGEQTTAINNLDDPTAPGDVLLIGSGFNPTGTQEFIALFANGVFLETTVARPENS